MSIVDVVRTWKDAELTGTAPEHPAGLVELSSLEYGGLRNSSNAWNTYGCCDTDKGCSGVLWTWSC